MTAIHSSGNSARTSPSINPSLRSRAVDLLRRAMLGARPLGPAIAPSSLAALALFNPAAVEAANVPAREKAVAKSGTEAWAQIKTLLAKGKTVEQIPPDAWATLDSAMYISDNTLIREMLQVRKEIIDMGATNPNIPPGIIHTALYTTSVVAEEIPKQIKRNNAQIKSLTSKIAAAADAKQKDELQKQIDDLKIENQSIAELRVELAEAVPSIIRFVGRDMFDTLELEGTTGKVIRSRNLIYPSEVKEYQGKYSKGRLYKTYTSQPFHKLGGYVAGQIISQLHPDDFLNPAGDRYLATSDKNVEAALATLFFNRGYTTKIPASVTKDLEEDFFGVDSLKACQKLMDQKKAGKKVTMDDLSVPGVPSGKTAGSYSALPKALQPFPRMQYHLHKSAKEQEILALGILRASIEGKDIALPAAACWFAAKPYSEAKADLPASSYSNADYIMLEVLAREASRKDERGKVAFEVLGQTITSFPVFSIYGAIGKGHKATHSTPLRYAYDSLEKAFNTHPERTKALMKYIASGQAKLIWDDPTQKADIESVQAARRFGLKYATQCMASNSDFRGHFLRVVNNPFIEGGSELRQALSTLALSKNTDQTLLHMLDIGLDHGKKHSTRSHALNAFLKAASHDPMRANIQKEIPSSPFNMQHGDYFYPASTSSTDMSPFEQRVLNRYAEILKAHQQYSNHIASKGGQPHTLSEVRKLRILLDLYDKEFPNTGVEITRLMGDKEFRGEYVPRMVSYLQGCKKTQSLDSGIGFPIMRILGTSGDPRAKEVLIDIATNPELYTKAPFVGNSGAKSQASAVTAAVVLATKHLGDSIDLSNPEDEGAVALHKLASRGATLFEDAALEGLIKLGERYEEKLSKLPKGEERTNLLKVRAVHVQQMFDHMKLRELGPYSQNKYSPDVIPRERLYAEVADKLGGRTKLLGRLGAEILNANKGKHKELNMPRTQFVRAWTQALAVNGYNPQKDNPTLGFNGAANDRLTKLFSYVTNQEFTLGQLPPLGDSVPTDTTKIAVIDGGYVPPGILKNVSYPDSSFDVMRPSDFTNEEHQIWVAGIIGDDIPGVELVSYHGLKQMEEQPFRPYWAQKAIPRILEHIAERNIQGDNVWATNGSLGFSAYCQYDPERRKNYFALMSAHARHLGMVGVESMNFAAGNDHNGYAQYYSGVFFPPTGELTSLGLGVDGNLSPNVNIVGAADFFPVAPKIAAFSSVGNPLRKESKELGNRILSFQGVQTQTLGLKNGKVVPHFFNGTSASSPMGTRMSALIKHFGGPTTADGLRKLYDSHVQNIPGRSAMEGGRYPNNGAILRQLHAEQVKRKQTIGKK